MKRRAIKLTLFVLAGAIINIAVAWGLVFAVDYNEPGTTVVRSRKTAEERPVVFKFQAFGSECLVGRTMTEDETWRFRIPTVVSDDPLVSWRTTSLDDEVANIRLLMGMPWMEEARGWPMRSVRCRVDEDHQGFRRAIIAGAHTREWRYMSGRGSFRTTALDRQVLPYDPIWPTFAINTIFYAAILWVLFAMPFKARRYFRAKRGLCPSCGYNLNGLSAASTNCPECGTPIASWPHSTNRRRGGCCGGGISGGKKHRTTSGTTSA